MAAGKHTRTDFAVGENKCLLREKQDLIMMLKKESCNKLVLCLSNMENWTRRLHLVLLYVLTFISLSDLKSA